MTDDPRSRRRAAAEGNWMTVPSGIDLRRDQPLGRVVVFTFWLIGLLLLGFVEWLIFCFSAINGNGCPSAFDMFGPTRTGGVASGGSLLTASVIGLSLWLAAGSSRCGSAAGSIPSCSASWPSTASASSHSGRLGR
jgi:hypothetical protein